MSETSLVPGRLCRTAGDHPALSYRITPAGASIKNKIAGAELGSVPISRGFPCMLFVV
jgi:hypothetical protein